MVALGLDASEKDPLAGLAVNTDGFRRIGEALARFGLPTVLVQEGGYPLRHPRRQPDRGVGRLRSRPLTAILQTGRDEIARLQPEQSRAVGLGR